MLGLVTRDVILSIKPRYADQIVAGVKTIELRRRFSSEALIGARAFIYSSSPAMAIIGYAVIANVRRMAVQEIWEEYADEAAITREEFNFYFRGLTHGYAISLRDACRLKTSATISDLRERFDFHAPQSYRYVGAEYSALIG